MFQERNYFLTLVHSMTMHLAAAAAGLTFYRKKRFTHNCSEFNLVIEPFKKKKNLIKLVKTRV